VPNLIPSMLIILIWCLPIGLATLPILLVENLSLGVRIAAIMASPMLFIWLFASVSGLLSLLGQSGIKKGRFARRLFDKIYFRRRLYGTCWTQIYYFKPIYSVVLSIPLLKWYVLRIFGYRGSCNFTIYPDTWIRDLPILKIGDGAYLSNRATIGTNVCMADGTIFVDSIQIDRKALIGHLAVLGPGAKVGENSEIGVGATLGIKTRIAKNAKVGVNATVVHGAVVEENAEVGNSCYIGMRARVSENIKIPAGTVVPAGTIINTQQDLNQIVHSEERNIGLRTEIAAKALADALVGGA